MKQLSVFLAALLGLLLLPRGTDVAKLAPAQLVRVERDGAEIVIRTDLGNVGRGTNLDAAFEDLKRTTPGVVFLDTAQYLVLDENSVSCLEELSHWVKKTCRVSIGEGIRDLQGASAYLQTHPPRVKIGESKAGCRDLPHLTELNGRFSIKQ